MTLSIHWLAKYGDAKIAKMIDIFQLAPKETLDSYQSAVLEAIDILNCDDELCSKFSK